MTVEHSAQPDSPGSGAPASQATLELPVEAVHAAARFSKSLEVALGEVNLSLPQYRLLVFLSGGPERAMHLANRLDVSPPSLTALVDGCVSRGLVERSASAEDRRRVVHVITEKGSEMLREADRVTSVRLTDIAGRLPAKEGRKIVEGLELLHRALDSKPDAGNGGKTT